MDCRLMVVEKDFNKLVEMSREYDVLALIVDIKDKDEPYKLKNFEKLTLKEIRDVLDNGNSITFVLEDMDILIKKKPDDAHNN